LPDIFGITSNWGKGIFGAAVVGGYFAAGGLALTLLFRRFMAKDFRRMSILQYSMVAAFMLMMIALPLKMLLRLMFHIKYVWITPYFNI